MASGSRADAKPCIPFPIPKNRSIAQVTPGLIDIPIEGDVTPAQFTPAPVSLETVTTEGRDRIRDCIARALSLLSEEDYERYKVSFKASDPSKVAAQVEAALFKHWGPDETMEPVAYRYSLLITLINNPWNKDLRRQVLLGEITPEMLANMSLAEMQQLNTWPEDDPVILI
ncbi:hypothetical protein ACFX2I_031107 [Malus domestica]